MAEADPACLRSSNFWILPVEVLGSSPKTTALGTLKPARCCLQWAIRLSALSCEPSHSLAWAIKGLLQGYVEADFNAAIDAFNTSLDEAGDDFCKITAATNTLTVSSAATPEQAKALYQAFADVLNKVADHLPVDSGADSATLKSAAEKILSDAEADGYDPATISGGSPEAFNDPEIAKSMAAVGEAITKNCQ